MIQHRQRGAALLLAMLIIGLVTTITAGMVWQQRRAVQIEAAERARAQATWILVGALDWARLILREDARANRGPQTAVDSLDEPWATPLAEARLSTFLAADKDNNTDSGPDAFISGSIADAQSRFNLRNLVEPDAVKRKRQLDVLLQLADIAGAPSDTASRISAGLNAAFGVDPSGDAPIRPSAVADLAWLGIDPATIERLRPYVEILPAPSLVNANTASREVLAAVLGVDLGTAERLVQARSRKPFDAMARIEELLPEASRKGIQDVVSIGSNWFEVVGRLRLEERALEEVSLLRRDNQDVTVVRSERRSLAAPRPGAG